MVWTQSWINELELDPNKDFNQGESTKLRRPSDSEAWKDIDKEYPEFLYEARHLRIAIRTDGFNPYSLKSSQYII